MDKLNVKDVMQYIELVTNLKHSSRKGWEYCDVPNHERIAGHMYAMAMMTFLLDEKSGLDRFKCMQLTLVHDLCESIVGDITPRDNIPEDVKHKMELEAMEKLTSLLGDELGGRMFALYQEYEKKETPEAKFVKDLDRFDMIFTAMTYEKRDNTPKKLQEFFDSTEGKFQHPFVKKLVAELENMRPRQSDSSNDD
ncbi:PREDICTED: HD domain-containing protein 2 [Nicrophorus vespilloides]|uniref:5'-deoxynucleotidase HDDC2 n=1 Tax=Nicrophorus vespilloides TaxID=110193 RepID=A0ABM1N2Z7_NICVS|nr:PREDICTED: HD domain-containing protein 2 [Nicrophorus vespilloides]XP_017781197.1 PREDICTED: HD domain-containing protein 2 [Nicrophorus vespilloides]XP_017781205.1 PREDICTED: HD domain-containing protein 2 [Nicrophorus vespilloides]